MVWKAALVWVVGLLTAVPYATYHLLFHADRSQYAGLIVFILAWTFGYWGLVGPLIAAVKVRRVFRALERVTSREELIRTLESPESQEVAIEHLASENHIPKFIAKRVYNLLVRRLTAPDGGPNPAAG